VEQQRGMGGAEQFGTEWNSFWGFGNRSRHADEFFCIYFRLPALSHVEGSILTLSAAGRGVLRSLHFFNRMLIIANIYFAPKLFGL
jgi:hypothetical protein